MKDFVKEVLLTAYGIEGRKTISLDTIKWILLTRYNKRSLMYPSVARNYLKNFFQIAQRLGYGMYDEISMRFVLNTENEEISSAILKHENAKKEAENHG